MSQGPGGPASESLDPPELLELPLEVEPEELPLLEVDPEELPLELDVDVLPLEAAPEEPLLELLPDPDVLASGVALELSSLEPQEQRIAVAMAIG